MSPSLPDANQSNLFDTLQIENSLQALSPKIAFPVTPGGFVRSPQLVAQSLAAASALGLSCECLSSEEFIGLFSASKIPANLNPFAVVYSGHQFQVWAGQLGDGRAVYLGQVVNQRGERWDIQLKGAGKTPFSRSGDGRAVLRSSIREFLCSEAMAGLKIPTTRALSVFTTGEMVQREEYEPGAILTRIAPSHIRFGHFEHFYHNKDYHTLGLLADQVIDQHFPHIVGLDRRYSLWFEEIVTRTAHLSAAWQAVGFCHGVMNTDNMSILGLTLDYGPFGFMEAFDPHWICNHSDHYGLYAYSEQPAVAHWNLHALALSLQPLLDSDDMQAILGRYEQIFSERFERLLCNKLGLPFDLRYRELWVSLLKLMATHRADFTNTFRQLAQAFETPGQWLANFQHAEGAKTWLICYRQAVEHSGIPVTEITATILATNPKYVLRNWIAEQAIRAAQDKQDYSLLAKTLAVLEKPFDEHPECSDLTSSAPHKYSGLVVSCSS